MIPYLAALQVNTTIQSLDLSRNVLGEEGGIALAEGLHTNTSLTALSLRGNTLGTSAGIRIAAVLRTRQTGLTNLDMSACGLRDAFVVELVSVLVYMKCTCLRCNAALTT